MADRGDTHYNLRRMNGVFMLTSAALLAIALWMVVDDWKRDWKMHQRDFQDLELQKAQDQMASIETEEFRAQREALEGQIDEIQGQLDNNAAYQDAVAAVDQATGEHYRAEAEFKIAQAKFNWSKYLLNQAWAAEGGDVDTSDYDEKLAVLNERTGEKEVAAVALAAAEAELAKLTAARDAKAAELDALQRDSMLIQDKITALQPGVFKALRDAPGLDFVAPTIKVSKQVLPDLRKNYNFTTVQRVDMCASCHAAIDVPGYESGEQPLASHPRLDLFLSPSSPHPVAKFGCTVCHEGVAESLDFTRVVHMPDSDEQKHEWEEEYHWHRYHYWDWPMLPTRYTEAGCYSCHAMSGTLETIAEDAPKLTKGLELMEDYGCYSCHNVQGWRVDRKSGPSLRNIKEKAGEEWVRSWIANPHDFRESTKMPQIFHLENRVSKEWDDTSISAVQTYLWSVSEGQDVGAMPSELEANADADRGAELFQQVGCTACHNSNITEPHDYSEFGPDLAGIGTKLSEDWLYAWISDPTAIWPDTRMPNLRLEPQDSADIARYLANDKKSDWSPIAVPVDSNELDKQALAFLERRYSKQESAELLDTWKSEGQDKVLAEVGKQWISRQGCYSCHDIPGFENSMPIGTDLSDWGNKNVHQLAFELWNEAVPGHFDGARDQTRPDFAELKLSNPRRFDRGLEVAPLDRLRMPDFKLDDDEIEALTTAVLGLKDDRELIREGARPQPDELTKALDRGAFLVRRNNCYGCHKFEMDTLLAQNDDGDPVRYHGLVTLEDEDDEATFFQLWKTDPDSALEDEEGGRVGNTVYAGWSEENEDGDYIPWPVKKGAGGGMLAGLQAYYVENGTVGSDIEAFPLVPPILYREGEKVRAPWVTQFLLAPYTLRPWLVVRMPTFKLTEEDSQAIALWFAALSVQEWPSRYARELRRSQAMSLDEMAEAVGMRPDQLANIEAAGRLNQNAFNALKTWGDAQGFEFDPPPGLPFEQIKERSPAYLAELEAVHPGYLEQGGAVVGPEGVNCYACHIRDGKTPGGDPLSWGPDLAYAKDRLRPDWIRQWVDDAQQIYPGTKMPTAIDLLRDPKLDSIMEASAEERLEAVKDFLMNSDRVRSVATPQTGK